MGEPSSAADADAYRQVTEIVEDALDMAREAVDFHAVSASVYAHAAAVAACEMLGEKVGSGFYLDVQQAAVRAQQAKAAR